MAHSYKGRWAVTEGRWQSMWTLGLLILRPLNLNWWGARRGLGILEYGMVTTLDHLFFQSIQFMSKWPYPESDQSAGNPLFTMTLSQCTCKTVMMIQAFSQWNQHCAKALCWKAWVAKRSWWCLGIVPSNRCCQFSMISQIWEEIYL